MNPATLINAQTLFTLGGGALAVTILTNVSQYVFGWSARWVGLLVAVALAGVGAAVAGSPKWYDWIVALFQGLQIYATAVGITTVTGSRAPRTQKDRERSVTFERERSAPPSGKQDEESRQLWPRWF